MFAVQSPDFDSPYLAQLRQWFTDEWGQVDPFESHYRAQSTPAPLLALADEQLLGGLAFTWYAKPGETVPDTDKVLWVNALLVSPERRKAGIGSELIRAAARAVAEQGIEELFVYTDIPALYQKQGWQLIEQADEQHWVLRKVLV